jgi:Rieske Fe-S protein
VTTVPDRRTVLKAVGAAAALGGGVAACGDGRPARSVKQAPAAGTRLIASADVPVGGGVILPDVQLVVTQPTAGVFKGFSFICTHAGCPVTAVQDGSIICPCHGSHFSITTGEPAPGSPATRPLAAQAVTEQNGEVVAG